MSTSLRGRLLVAMPVIDEPSFARTVVLLLDHDDDGALGIVLNRRSPVPVDEALAAWAPLVTDPRVVFGGGPVEPTAVVALGQVRDAQTPDPAADADEVLTGAPEVFEGIRLVDLEQEPDPSLLARVRVFAGYAGWTPGQLEDEIDEGAWLVVAAEADDLFTPAPELLWREVLGRQPGRERLLASFPDDPRAN
jgi:putative transcriptional regulator